jgi:hypothetical protein
MHLSPLFFWPDNGGAQGSSLLGGEVISQLFVVFGTPSSFNHVDTKNVQWDTLRK